MQSLRNRTTISPVRLGIWTHFSYGSSFPGAHSVIVISDELEVDNSDCHYYRRNLLGDEKPGFKRRIGYLQEPRVAKKGNVDAVVCWRYLRIWINLASGAESTGIICISVGIRLTNQSSSALAALNRYTSVYVCREKRATDLCCRSSRWCALVVEQISGT